MCILFNELQQLLHLHGVLRAFMRERPVEDLFLLAFGENGIDPYVIILCQPEINCGNDERAVGNFHSGCIALFHNVIVILAAEQTHHLGAKKQRCADSRAAHDDYRVFINLRLKQQPLINPAADIYANICNLLCGNEKPILFFHRAHRKLGELVKAGIAFAYLICQNIAHLNSVTQTVVHGPYMKQQPLYQFIAVFKLNARLCRENVNKVLRERQ